MLTAVPTARPNGTDRVHQNALYRARRIRNPRNAILPGAVDDPRIQRVFEGRAKVSGKPIEQIKKEAMAVQSLKHLVDQKDIAALSVFLASDAAKSISGQMLPIDNDMQQAS